MFHHRAWSPRNTLLFRDSSEALALWRILVRTFPNALSMCLMPDHVHLLLPEDGSRVRLSQAESAYARWRNAHRQERGAVFARQPDVQPVPEDRERRVVRYIHLNPVRKGLVDDPLGWPFSTHRDLLRLAVPAIGEAEREPARFHRMVSGYEDAPSGTPFPTIQLEDFAWEDVRDAVTSVCRVPIDALTQRTEARRLALKTAWMHGVCDLERLRQETGAHRSHVYRLVVDLPPRTVPVADEGLDACLRAVGDPRFRGLGGLAQSPGWRRWYGFRR